jgi:hypothetical protein
MRIYLISGDGIGAGKSTLARLLVNPSNVWSLADALRDEVARIYPGYPWYSKEQHDKNLLVKETGCSVRDVLISWGQGRCLIDPLHYARRLADKIEASRSLLTGAIAVDDLRKLVEVGHIRKRFPGCVTHIHVSHPDAIPEPQYDNACLSAQADYVLHRRRT